GSRRRRRAATQDHPGRRADRRQRGRGDCDRAPLRRGRVVRRRGQPRPQGSRQSRSFPGEREQSLCRGRSSDRPGETVVKAEATQTPVFGRRDPDARGYFGAYGGRFVPETLVAPIEELTAGYYAAREDNAFCEELDQLLKHYVGRPTPLYEARNLAKAGEAGRVGRVLSDPAGVRVFLKREDLTHTGAHKINNALGQALLAKRMGKRRVVAETGAGQ